MFGYIYKTTNLINKKIYIGKRHNSNFIPDYFGSGLLINRAIDKYGIENFEVELIDKAYSIEELNEKEKYHILNSNSFYKFGIGYNIASGGDGGNLIYGWSPERYKKHIEDCRLRNTGINNPNFRNGKKISGDLNPSKRIEVRNKLKISSSGTRNGMFGVTGKNHPRYGKKLTKEERIKISNSLKGEKHPNFGKHHSEDTKLKMSQTQKGRTFTEEHKQNMRGKIRSEEHRRKLSEARKNKRYKCFCEICEIEFQGKAWNSSKCENCKITPR